MKKVLRNNLWMMIVAWCLVLNNYAIWGIIVGALASLYLSINVKYKNYWRILAIFLMCFSFCYLLSRVTILYLFPSFIPFLSIVALNVAVLNERLQKERIMNLFPHFIVMLVSLIVFMLVAAVLPNSMTLANAKTNLYGLIILVFIPYTFETLINLIIKEYNMKRFIDKVKTNNSSKMYN